MMERNTRLEPLSPNSNLNDEHYLYYKQYLDDALSSSHVHNIAITGKYGSGKSSIIDTYFKARSDFLRVNFATFDSKIRKESIDDNQDKNSIIFSNIINQIIYQINIKKIPLTKFKVKNPISIWTKIAWITEILLLTSYIIKFDIQLPKWVVNGKVGVILLIGILLLWRILSKIEVSRFKFSLKQLETEIDMSQDDLFEKYTDEIIYLFENSDKNILIIEDLDRFNDLSIFEKLRELNTKLNYKTGSGWKFIYLIKDELFVNRHDRVKFFDEIIPVIPFVTSSNSFDKLRKLFDNDKISLRLLRILGVYIDDYRLLLNISNEFKVYENVNGSTDLNELLALIAYKNLYPSEFDKLQNGEGDLARVVQEYKSKIDIQISDLEARALELQNKKDSTFISSEIDYLYVWASKHNLMYTSQTNSRPVYRIDSIEISKRIIDQDLVVGANMDFGRYSEWKKTDKLFIDGLTVVTGYDEELLQINEKIKRLNSSVLSDIKRDDFEINDILFTFIKNGFVTLDYLNVINHYYGDISTLTFMKNILSESDSFDMLMALNDIDGLINQLEESDYDKKQILNVHLAAWFFANDDPHFDHMVKMGAVLGTGFVEVLLNENPHFYEKIVEAVPDIQFNLSQLNDINIADIINNNYYAATNSNIDILVKWLEDSNITDTKYVELINNCEIYVELKTQLIRHNPKLFTVNNLKSLDHIDLWIDLMKNDLVSPKNSNINIYEENLEMDEAVTSFINEHILTTDEPLSDNVFLWTLGNSALTLDKFIEIWSCYDGNKLTYEQVKNTDNNKIQFLIDSDNLEMTAELITVVDQHNLKISQNWDLHDLKKIIIEKNITINSQQLLGDLLKYDDDLNNLIFANNLNILSRDSIIRYIKKVNLTSGKILKVIERRRAYQNNKFEDDIITKKILEWLVNQQIIDGYEPDGLNKLKLIVTTELNN